MKKTIQFCLLGFIFTLTTISAFGQSCSTEISKQKSNAGYVLCTKIANERSAVKWNTGATTRCITVTKAGEYCAEVINADSCIAKACTKTEDVTIACNYTITKTPTSGGSVMVCANSDNTKSIKWNTGDTTKCITVSKLGEYCALIKGENCETKACTKVEISSSSCNVSIIKTAIATGYNLCALSTSAISYKWSTGDTSKCINVPRSGEYCVAIKGRDNCETKACVRFGDTTSSCRVEISKVVSPTGNILCAISSNGKSYRWNTGDTTKCINATKSGEYCVTVVGNNNCEAKTCIKVEIAPQPCRVEISRVPSLTGYVLCAISPNGKSFKWNTGDTSKCISVTKSAEYCVTVNGANNCETKACVKVEITPPACRVEIIKTSSNGGFNLCAISPNTKSYRWNTGDTSKCINTTKTGEYCVTVVGNNNCEVKSCVKVEIAPPSCRVEISRAPSLTGYVLCAVSPNGKSFKWNTGDTSKCISVTKSAEYCVTVNGANGCESKACVKVEVVPQACKVEVSKTAISDGYQLCAVSLAKVTSVLWSTGDSSLCIKTPRSGEYCVTITGENNCQAKTCVRFETTTNACSAAIQKTIATDGTTTMCVTNKDGQPLKNIKWSTGDTTSCIVTKRPGTFCATVITANGCRTTACATNVSKPDTSRSCKVNITRVKRDGKLYLCANTSYKEGEGKIVWNTGDTSNCIFLTKTGKYCVDFSINNCKANACITVDTLSFNSSILENSNLVKKAAESSISIGGYGPNPTGSEISIGLVSKIDQKITYTITDANGKIYSQKNYIVKEGINSLSFEMENLKNGLYFINIITADSKQTVKVFKQ
jgi:trimeric autotransporter adhesin